MKDTSRDLCGNRLLQNNSINTSFEIKACVPSSLFRAFSRCMPPSLSLSLPARPLRPSQHPCLLPAIHSCVLCVWCMCVRERESLCMCVRVCVSVYVSVTVSVAVSVAVSANMSVLGIETERHERNKKEEPLVSRRFPVRVQACAPQIFRLALVLICLLLSLSPWSSSLPQSRGVSICLLLSHTIVVYLLLPLTVPLAFRLHLGLSVHVASHRDRDQDATGTERQR